MAQMQEDHRKEMSKILSKQSQKMQELTEIHLKQKAMFDHEIAALKDENAALVKKDTALIEENLLLKEKLSPLQTVHVFRHKTGIVFKRSIETGNQWRAFCPNCEKPMVDVDLGYENARACCIAPSPPCGRCFPLPRGRNLEDLAREIPLN
jgi:hypothetical protein